MFCIALTIKKIDGDHGAERQHNTDIKCVELGWEVAELKWQVYPSVLDLAAFLFL